MVGLNVNSKELSKFSNKLEKMHQSAFPNAVRGTLTGMAIDVKKVTMPKTSREFTNRNKTFFSANSKYLPARGFDVQTMQSVVGMFPNANVKNDKAVKELEQQENGGVIKDRELIPLSDARITLSNNRKVSTNNRLGKLKPDNIKLSTKRSFVKDVHKAGRGGYIRTKKSILQVKKIKKTKFEFKRLYKINNKGVVKITKPIPFMKTASLITAKKSNRIYIKEAQRQYERYYNS